MVRIVDQKSKKEQRSVVMIRSLTKMDVNAHVNVEVGVDIDIAIGVGTHIIV